MLNQENNTPSTDVPSPVKPVDELNAASILTQFKGQPGKGQYVYNGFTLDKCSQSDNSIPDSSVLGKRERPLRFSLTTEDGKIKCTLKESSIFERAAKKNKP